MRINIAVLTIFLFAFKNISGQCCSGGSGSPIAGGTSQGVLLDRQIDLSTNIQFISTDKFYSKDSQVDSKTFDSFQSTYEYFRLGYGISKNLMMSIESGYYFTKREVGLNDDPATTFTTKGFGDLILFPRYDIINWTEEDHRTEVTVGLGYKIPLGSYNDSVGNIEPFSGTTYYTTLPQTVQLSSGAQDIIFYLFTFRGYPLKEFRFFANALYIKKGWNPNGEKLGDFMSFGLFAGKTFFKNLGVNLQARYETVKQMQINEAVYLFGRPSTYDPDATGYKKVFIVPQVSYSKGKFTFYVSTDIPAYQYVNSNPNYTQVGSEYLTTLGLSYRFFVTGITANKVVTDPKYFCPMHPDIKSAKHGICPKCGMELEPIKN